MSHAVFEGQVKSDSLSIEGEEEEQRVTLPAPPRPRGEGTEPSVKQTISEGGKRE